MVAGEDGRLGSDRRQPVSAYTGAALDRGEWWTRCRSAWARATGRHLGRQPWRRVDGRFRFAPDLEQNLARGDETFEQFSRSVDEYILRHRLAAPEDPHHKPRKGSRLRTRSVISELDARSAGITSVIWAIGYRYDLGWIKCAVFDANGRPVHRRGVTATPGLYFLGLPRLHKVKSAFLWGVGEDAAYLAEHIVNRK